MNLQDRINNLNSIIDQRLNLQIQNSFVTQSPTKQNEMTSQRLNSVSLPQSQITRLQSNPINQQYQSQILQSEQLKQQPATTAIIYHSDGKRNENPTFWKQKIHDIQEQLEIINSNPLIQQQLAVRYQLFEQEFEKLCQQTNQLSIENEQLQYKLKNAQFENMRLNGKLIEQSYFELEIKKLKEENMALCKKLEEFQDENTKIKIAVIQKDEKVQTLEHQLSDLKKDFQIKIQKIEDKAEADLQLFKHQHIEIVTEQFRSEREPLLKEIAYDKKEKEKFNLEISRLGHLLNLQKKNIENTTQQLNKDLEDKQLIIQNLQQQNHQKIEEINNLKIELKTISQQFLNLQLQKDQEIHQLKMKFEYEKSQEELKLNLVIKDNEKLNQQLQQQQELTDQKVKDIENFHRQERKKLVIQDSTQLYNSVQQNQESNDQKVFTLHREIIQLNDRIKELEEDNDNIRRTYNSEIARMKKDTELWIINSQEIEKEKDNLRQELEAEYKRKLAAFLSQQSQ